ncbi:MAG: hypothetical protein ACTSW1_11510 [Candidatus Hodarchaeales archaeon]
MTRPHDQPETEVLGTILDRITHISDKIDILTESIEKLNSTLHDLYLSPSNVEIQPSNTSERQALPSSIDLIKLQELRPGIFRTYKALQKHPGWISSQELANLTKRSRGLESRYLTYLAKQGLVVKKRIKSKSDPRATEVLYKMVGVDE